MKIKVDKRKWHWTLGIVGGLLVLLCLGCLAALGWVTTRLPSLDAADRWRGSNDMRFAQIACFLPIDEGKTEDDIWQFRRTLEQKLTEASVAAPAGGKLYQDAWSTGARVQVEAEHGKAQVQAIGVGGEFFLFHPLQLRSGAYLSEQDLMQDRVVLDEALAWQLFGGVDVAGKELFIGGRPFYVAGVVHREDDFASRRAYRDGPGMFLSYTALNQLTQRQISTYEIVLPDMISGFGLSLVEENFSVGETGAIVENSRRYSLPNLFRVIGNFGERSMGLSGVIYPYWENAVRLTEDYASALLLFALIFALIPAIAVVVLFILALTKSGRYVKTRVPAAAGSLVEKHREAKYEKMKHRQETGAMK